jgi:superfamily II DNA or RNA helicase
MGQSEGNPPPSNPGPGLASQTYPSVYESGRSDLISEFYTPCLSNSEEYCRAVGYFSSSLLPLISKGLERFVSNNGKMRLVLSPSLTADDVEAIEKGYRERGEIDRQVGDALIRNLEQLIDYPGLEAAVKNLAWLVSHRTIDVKVAVPMRDGEVLRGIYHEKLGYFRDLAGLVVSFQGSQNETEFAVWANFESLWVCTSWESSPPPRQLTDILRMFEARWNNATPGLQVIDFPQAPREWLHSMERGELVFPELPARFKQGKPTLRPYQAQALSAWVSSGRRGILAMATGTGKTLVALDAIQQEVRAGRSVLVAVPTRLLLSQWDIEARKRLEGTPILRISGGGDWKQPGVIEKCLSGNQPTVLLGVTNTLVKDTFFSRARASLAKKPFTLIVDEVHHVGSEVRARLLALPCDHRLGLSATPERQYDEAGSSALQQYFVGVVYRFDIGDAIQAGVLARYQYFPEEVMLTGDEGRAYERLAKRIAGLANHLAKLLGLENGPNILQVLQVAWKRYPEEAASLNTLLQQRADITKKAEGKIPMALAAFGSHPTMRRALVYCDDHDQLEKIEAGLNASGVSTVRYVGEMDELERYRTLKAIEGGTARAVLSMKCLDEGVDVPVCDGAIILASSKTWREFIQRRGRVLRLHPEKNFSTIVDAVVVPPGGRFTGSRGLVEAELNRASIFMRDAANRAIAESVARRIALKYGVNFDEMNASSRPPV